MVLPLADGLPTRRLPVITLLLIGANVLVFLWQRTTGHADIDALRFGFVPLFLFQGLPAGYDIGAVPAAASLVTYAFLHGDIWHIGGNLLFLWIFGNNVEDVLGRLRFIVFYLLCAALAGLAQGLAAPLSHDPLIGASGAISGILGAYLRLFPRQRVVVLVGILPLPVPAYLVIGLWFGVQLVDGFSGAATADHIAWLAHVGGFVAGLVLLSLFRPRLPRGPWG